MINSWIHTSPAQQVMSGPTVVKALPEMLRTLGIRRALLVTTAGRVASAEGELVVTVLGRSLGAVFDQVEPHVPAPVVQSVGGAFRDSGADGIVSLGGGSAIDTAKALAFFAEHEAGSPGSGFADRPLLPHVAIPTTLVGAAYTATFSMVDPHARRSTSAGGLTTTPTAVMLDLSFIAELPGESFAASAVVALAHGLDVVWSSAATPEARALALAGLTGLARSAPAAVAAPDDLELRAQVVNAAMLCGRARQNASDGLQQALAQLVGARSGIPHVAAHAALLLPTTQLIADVVPESQAAAVEQALAPIAQTAGNPDTVADLVSAFLDQLGYRPSLGDLGVDDEDLDAVARQSGSQRGVQTAARPVGEADIRALLDDAF